MRRIVSPNTALRDARLACPSQLLPGTHMSRSELATTANALLHAKDILDVDINAGYVAKLEAGEYRWPRSPHRRWALRTALKVKKDTEIGLYPDRVRWHEGAATRSDPSTPAPAEMSSSNVDPCSSLRVISSADHGTDVRPEPALEPSAGDRLHEDATREGGLPRQLAPEHTRFVATRMFAPPALLFDGPERILTAYRDAPHYLDTFEELLGQPLALRDRERQDESAERGSSVDVDRLEAAALMAAHESSEHAASISRDVSATDVDGVQDAVKRLARRYHQESPLRLLANARHIRNLAYTFLDRTRRPSQTADLYLAAGQACGLLAVASFDLALWDAAEEQARSAYTYADMVGHPGLRAWARGTQALIANWMERPRRALELIDRGIDEAPSGSANARLRSIQARAWADLGQLNQVDEVLRLADIDIDAAQRDDSLREDLHDGIGGEFGWGPSRHAACAGTALLKVGDADRAVQRIQQALAMLPSDPSGGLVAERVQIDLASAELVAGRLDASVAALDTVWALPAPQRRHGLTGRLDQLARHLTTKEWRDVQEAGELRDRIEAFNVEATTVRALPAA
jgi:tetratricopeptide (TPR) repeat protein